MRVNLKTFLFFAPILLCGITSAALAMEDFDNRLELKITRHSPLLKFRLPDETEVHINGANQVWVKTVYQGYPATPWQDYASSNKFNFRINVQVGTSDSLELLIPKGINPFSFFEGSEIAVDSVNAWVKEKNGPGYYATPFDTFAKKIGLPNAKATLVDPLPVDDITQLPLNEAITARRFTPRDIEEIVLRNPGMIDRAQHGFKGKTFLFYNVSGENYACLFYALQVPRETLISAIIEAAQRDDAMGIEIRNVLRTPVLENLGLAEEAFNPMSHITKGEAVDFLEPFKQDGVFAPYEVALAYGILHNKQVFVWQYQTNKEVSLLGYNENPFPESIHLGYYPRHFQRLVLEEDTPEVAFNKALSLLIEHRASNRELSSFITENEKERLKKRVDDSPNSPFEL